MRMTNPSFLFFQIPSKDICRKVSLKAAIRQESAVDSTAEKYADIIKPIIPEGQKSVLSNMGGPISGVQIVLADCNEGPCSKATFANKPNETPIKSHKWAIRKNPAMNQAFLADLTSVTGKKSAGTKVMPTNQMGKNGGG